MKFRSGLTLLFLLPVAWGVFSLLGSVAAATGAPCPGIVLGEDGEDYPGPMRPGQTCALYDGGRPTGTATYQQRKNAQAGRHDDLLVRGMVYTAYGLAGLAALWLPYGLPWRRKS